MCRSVSIHHVSVKLPNHRRVNDLPDQGALLGEHGCAVAWPAIAPLARALAARQARTSSRSLAFASATVCHCIFSGLSMPPAHSGMM